MNLAACIDFTLLDPDAPPARVEELCRTAVDKGYVAVCVLPRHVPLAVRLLEETPVLVASVVGFPTGDHDPAEKLRQAESLARAGADELDYVVNRPAVAAGSWDVVEAEAQGLSQLCQSAGVTLKMILESGRRSAEELERLCELATWFGVDYVKTSTGTAAIGAREEDVRRLRELLPPLVRIKASGGIKNADFARTLIAAGADRIGTSSILT